MATYSGPVSRRLEEGRWKLDKYARYLMSTSSHVGHEKPEMPAPAISGGEWKMYDNREDILHLSLLTTSHLLVSQGDKIMENYSLIDTRNWMRVVSKGDSVLFLCKVRDENRRFRIKFSDDEKGSGLDHCKDFTRRAAHYITVKNTSEVGEEKGDSKDQSPPLKLSGTVRLDEIATKLKNVNLPLAYAQTNLPTEQIGTMVRLCLADPNFPAFVGQVEQELKKIKNDKVP
ncbi:meiotic recombination protein REC114-like [Lineus longissimus]|uniref:meiotic recombination protein REC114-like n=1 Tax=Lineus longissimus TaxID=88925 RepID=UPI00315C888A